MKPQNLFVFLFYFATSDNSYHVTPPSSNYSQSGPVPQQQQQQQQIPTGGPGPLRKVIATNIEYILLCLTTDLFPYERNLLKQVV